ncbi:MAG: hypothetical protein J0H68_05405 [Sphingobacteriia bacterium]|nr:hypothetical protein [Sphingobacteriia bacterium]
MIDKLKEFFGNLKNNKLNQFKLELPSSDFIPYACHINPRTILTKNGDIFQSIKIVGFSDQLLNSEGIDIRDKIRQTILSHIDSKNFAIWFHTIRTRRNIDPGGFYPFKFTKILHNLWNKKNYWDDKYINEIYITIAYAGMNFKFNSIGDLFSTTTLNSIKKKHAKYLNNIIQILTYAVDKIYEDLAECGAEILQLKSDESLVTSEIVDFLSKIVNLKDQKLPLPVVDLSKYLINHKVAFGNNSFEIASRSGKYFGTILSIKEYHEINTKLLNNLLLLPTEMVITQTLHFVEPKKVTENFKFQDYILEVSLDDEFREFSGLKKILSTAQGKETDFGATQVTIMLSAENQNLLNQQVERCVKAIQNLGFAAFREDLNMEDLFWSQLPANFNHIKRTFPINTALAGGFLSLNNYPAGKHKGVWENAVTIFRTKFGTPYFFNFHNINNNGNLLILGPKESYKTLLANFIICEATKFEPSILFVSPSTIPNLITKVLKGNIISELSENNNYSDEKISHISFNSNFSKDLLLKYIHSFLESITHERSILIIDDLNSLCSMTGITLNDCQNIISKTNSNKILVSIMNSENLEEDTITYINSFGTKIFTTDPNILEKNNFKRILNPNELKAIKNLNFLLKEFLIKQDKDVIIAELNIAGLEEAANILNNDPKANIDKYINEENL